MKKFLLPLCIFIFSQSHSQVSVGIMAGGASAGVSKVGNLNVDRSVQPTGGLLIDYQFPASGLHLQSGVLYAPLGYKSGDIPATSPASPSFGLIASHQVGYVQVPAWLNYGSMSINFAFRAGIGPFIAFKTGDKLKIQGGDTFGNGTAYPLNTTGLSPVIAGAGLHLSANFYHLQIALEYQQGLTSMYKKISNSTTKWLPNTFGLHLGYFFRTVHEGF